MTSENPDMLYPIAEEERARNANNRINKYIETWK